MVTKDKLAVGQGWIFIIQVEGNPESSFAGATYTSQRFKNREDAFRYYVAELKRIEIADEVSKLIRSEFKLSE